MTGVLINYEVTTFALWDDFTKAVRYVLEAPIIVKNTDTNQIELNLDSSFNRLIRESEGANKLSMPVPQYVKDIVNEQDKVFAAYETMKALIIRNRTLRL